MISMLVTMVYKNDSSQNLSTMNACFEDVWGFFSPLPTSHGLLPLASGNAQHQGQTR